MFACYQNASPVDVDKLILILKNYALSNTFCVINAVAYLGQVGDFFLF